MNNNIQKGTIMLTISSAEWEVMRVLWAKGQATSSEIIEVLAKKLDWSASTVKTLIGRLADKGYLTSQRQGRGFIYQASLGEDEANFQVLEAVFDKICLTKHSDLLGQFMAKTPMTQADVDKLQALLAAKEPVDQVVCDCVPGQCACGHHMEVI